MECKICNQRLTWAGMKYAPCHKWHSVQPIEEGIYWMDPFGNKEFLFVAQAFSFKNKINFYIFGSHGSAPGDYLHSEVTKNIKFKTIYPPTKWVKIKDTYNNEYMWVKTPDQSLAFGILRNDCDKKVGTLIWEPTNKNNKGSDSGVCIGEKDNYLFCPVNLPK